jgi:hypothetical protein
MSNETFNLIVKNILNMDNNFFSPMYDKSDKINNIIKCYFGNLINNYYNKSLTQHKFYFFKNCIHDFYIKNHIDEVIIYFCKIQKTYHILNRLIFKHKHKKSKIVVSNDMQLNEINENEKNIICIYHFNSRYLFKIQDLLKIINTSLTNSYLFFAEPIAIKNPYNNLPFNKSVLYYIYFYIIEKNNLFFKTNQLDLFFKYFNCDFNLSLFIDKYEHLLREFAIENYVNNSLESCLYEEIISMIKEFNIDQKKSKNKIIINSLFPKSKLIKAMKSFLLLRMKSLYSLIPHIKENAKFDLYYKLKEFKKKNPKFGRKRIVLIDKISETGTIHKIHKNEFYDKYICLKNNKNENFLENHLTFIQEINNNNSESETISENNN